MQYINDLIDYDKIIGGLLNCITIQIFEFLSFVNTLI